MDRRALLRRTALAGAAALSGGVAGCLGGGEAPTDGYEDLIVDDFNVSEGEGGNLVVAVTVANTASEDRRGTLYVNVEANGTADTRARRVEVGPAETTDLEVAFDASYDAFNDGGNLSFDFDEA